MPSPLRSNQSPVVAFGFFALATGLKAKFGRLRLSDRLALAERALAWCHADDDVCLAASNFLSACYVPENVPAAGAALLDFLSTWMDAQGIEATEEILRHADTVKPEAMRRARRDAVAAAADDAAAFDAAVSDTQPAGQHRWQRQRGAGFDFDG